MTLFIATIAVPQKKKGAIVRNEITVGGMTSGTDSPALSAETGAEDELGALRWGSSMQFEIDRSNGQQEKGLY
jgi:hypothetical protein